MNYGLVIVSGFEGESIEYVRFDGKMCRDIGSVERMGC